MFSTISLPSSGISLSLSSDVFMSAALDAPSSMLLMTRPVWNLKSAEKDEEAEETSDLESNGDSDPDSDVLCMAAPTESSSEVEWATGRENERASR